MMISRDLLQRVAATAMLCLPVIFAYAGDCSAQEATDQYEQLSQYNLMIQYTKTNRDLADVELQRAMAKNEDNIIVIPRLTIERLRSNLTVAEEQFKQANLASTGGPAEVQLRHAQEKVRIAQMELDAGRRLKSADAITDLDLKRLELRHELAQVKVVMLQNPDNFVTLMDHMERRMDRLGEEILSLDQRLSQLEATGR